MTRTRPLSRRASVLLAVAIASAGLVARGQPPPPSSAPAIPVARAVTLAEALELARAHQPAIRLALARLAARQREARVPRSQWLPRLGATAQIFYGTANNTTASYLNVREVDLPRIGGTGAVTAAIGSPAPSTLAAVSLGQEVYDSGRIAAQAAVADALVDIAREDAELTALEVTLGAEEAFDAVLASHEVLAAATDAEKRAAAHRDFASAGVKSGMRPPVDLTRASADLAAASVRRIRAETGLRAARSTLAGAIGSEALEVEAAPAPAASPPPSPALAEALDLAKRRSPVLLAALAEIHAREAATRAVTRELLPDVAASAGVSGRAGGSPISSGEIPPGGGWLADVLNWHAGLVLRWNVFDATVLARRAASRARELEARADYERTQLDTVVAVQHAWLDLLSAEQTIPSLIEAATAAQANQGQAEARFKAGLGTAVELADAEALLTSAQVDLAIGRFTADRARALLARAIGQALSGLGPRGGPQ